MSSEEENNDDIKVILVGEMGTGKTSLINTSIGLQFQEKVASTIANTINNKTIQIEGENFSISLWDTIGQEKFRSLTKIFMKEAKIVIFVYDITKKETFDELNYWFKSTKDIISNDAVMGVVGNKSDLFLKEEITEEQGQKLAEEHGYEFSLTSAKLPEMFCNFLEKMVKLYLTKNGIIGNNKNNNNNNTNNNNKQKLKNKNNHNHKKKKCCS